MLSKKQRKVYEEAERIEVLGQESDLKAAKWVSEDFRERERQEEKEANDSFTRLSGLKNNKLEYNHFLVKLLFRFLEDEDIPPKYQVWYKVNKDGIRFGISRTRWQGAFQAVGIEKYDFFAAKTMAIKLGNTVAHLEGYRREKNGVILPDEEDIKKITKSI